MRGRAVAVAVMVCALGGQHVQLVLTPRAIHQQVPNLRMKGEADVALDPEGTYHVTQKQVLRVAFPDGPVRPFVPVTRQPVDLSVAQLIANCPDVPPFLEDRY